MKTRFIRHKIGPLVIIACFISNSTSVCAQVLFSDSGQSIGDYNKIAISDIDNDGDNDIVALYYNMPNKVLFNDGKGNFSLVESLGTKGNSLALADLDNDGDKDAFIVNGGYKQAGKPALVWMNDGKGTFSNSGQQLGNKYSTDVALSDLDGDGDIDAFVCNHAYENLTNGGHQIWLNNGKGVFSNSGQILGNAFDTSVKLADIDKDGDMDALVTSNSNWTGAINENLIWINDGKANFTKKILSSPYSSGLDFGDLDNDGDLDLLIAYQNYVNNSNIGAKILLNDGKGNFSTSSQLFENVHYNGISLGDFNSDGNLDALFANGKWFDDKPNTLWIGDGKGLFSKTSLSFGADDGLAVNIADLNNDTKMDAIVGAKIWINTTLIQTKIENSNEQSECKLIPNPSTGIFTVFLGSLEYKKTSIEILNSTNTLIFAKTYAYANDITIDLSGKPAGVYFIRIEAGGKVY